MIYSAKHRPSLSERAVNLIPTTVSLLFTWWLLFTGLLAVPPDTSLALLLLGLVVSMAIGVFIHEAGHLVVGLALGTAMRKIRVGFGPTLFTFRPRGLRVQICTNPLGGGAVYLSGLDHSSRDVRIAISAAGPTTNLLAALYGLVMVHLGVDWLGVFVFANLLLGVDNLIPHKFTLDGREQPTDGMQILQYIRGMAKRSLYYEGDEVAPDAQALQLRALEEARDAGSAEVTDMHLLLGLAGDRDVRPLLGGLNIAWASLMSGDPTLRPEALELARAAVAFEPDRLAFKGTLAFALMENGAVAGAAALLEPIVPSHPRPRDRALDLCLLAICHARLHDSEAAAKDLQAAEAADPRCQLLERARAEIVQSAAVAIT